MHLPLPGGSTTVLVLIHNTWIVAKHFLYTCEIYLMLRVSHWCLRNKRWKLQFYACLLKSKSRFLQRSFLQDVVEMKFNRFAFGIEGVTLLCTSWSNGTEWASLHFWDVFLARKKTCIKMGMAKNLHILRQRTFRHDLAHKGNAIKCADTRENVYQNVP